MFTSFGGSALLTLTIVVIAGVTGAYIAGDIVKEKASDVMRDQVVRNLLESSRYLAEEFSGYVDSVAGTSQLLVEISRDRIVGYPEEGWEDDRFVPFFDMESQSNVYPFNHSDLVLDWAVDVNINDDNAEEHLQERTYWAKVFGLSTSPVFFMSGSCEPGAANTSLGYHPKCSEESNNIETGGIIVPSEHTRHLYEKGAEIGALLKPLYEAEADIVLVGLYLRNAGSGAVVYYPGLSRDGSMDPYTSIGCSWMAETNPYTGRPFAPTEERVKCHPAGTLVHQREYNPMERRWCREMVLNPDRVIWYGPFLANDGGIPLLMVGRAVFDRV